MAAGTDDGLRRIVEAAGLSWAEAEVLANGTGLPDFEEQNRRILYLRGYLGIVLSFWALYFLRNS